MMPTREDNGHAQHPINPSLKEGTGVGVHPLHLFRFCPECGSPRFVEHNAKSKHCEACGFTYYFNPSAATVALIEREVPVRGDESRSTRGKEGLASRERVTERRNINGQGVNGKSVNERSVEWLCVRRAKDPARGTLDLPGGFSDMFETSEEGVIREVKEETGLDIDRVEFLFSLPNQYLYSGFLVHTIDMFYRCHVRATADGTDPCAAARAADDAGELLWLRPEDINPADFGLLSVRRGIERLIGELIIKREQIKTN